MKDLKTKTIGDKTVVLQVVPAKAALLLQRKLGELFSGAACKGVTIPATSTNPTVAGAIIGLGAVSELLTKLNDAEFLALIESISKHIYINGKKLDIDTHFTADTLLDFYEVICWFFMETFGGFFAEIRSRFPQLEKMMEGLRKSNPLTSTGISGGPA